MVCGTVHAEKASGLYFDSRWGPHLRQGFGMPIEAAGAGGLVYFLAERRRRFQSREGRSIRPLAGTSQGEHGTFFGCEVAASHLLIGHVRGNTVIVQVRRLGELATLAG